MSDTGISIDPRDVTIVASSFNDALFVPSFLNSLRPILQRGAGLTVVDSLSSDGTDRLLEGGGATVIHERCTLGSGRNKAIRRAASGHVLVVDVDNVYQRLDVLLEAPARGAISVGIDGRYRNAWFALGERALFLRHPFVDQGGPGSGGGAEDLLFFCRAPVSMRVYDHLAVDLKRRRPEGLVGDLRANLRFRNGWFRHGLTWTDVGRLLLRMAKAPGGTRYFLSDVGVVSSHILSLGRTGRV